MRRRVWDCEGRSDGERGEQDNGCCRAVRGSAQLLREREQRAARETWRARESAQCLHEPPVDVALLPGRSGYQFCYPADKMSACPVHV